MKSTKLFQPTRARAAAITKSASHQTYYTIRLLADRDRWKDAYLAYAYFRWVDDMLDAWGITPRERGEFVRRQQDLLAACYRQEFPLGNLTPEEQMLVELVGADGRKSPQLWAYLNDMMSVMAFDAGRRGSLISESELNEYTRHLASAVTEAMHHFVGHRCCSPHDDTRYLAVSAAHITHMLRDTVDDLQAGYYNVPREMLEAHGISAQDIHCAPYRAWVKSRVELARQYFEFGRGYLGRVPNLRCRLAGLAYCSRFEDVLDSIEREEYRLRANYPECEGWSAMARAGGSILTGFFGRQRETAARGNVPSSQRSLREL